YTRGRLWPAEFPAHAREIDLFALLGEGLEAYQEKLDYNGEMFGELAGRAVRTLAAQRAAHDRVEEIYIAGMDFDALNAASEKMIEELLQASGNVL
ncbi:MAG: hypothetical protein LBB75_06415, partial [Oscillospiraceae bacterium]|nr:hypothetical protein [Oscillospiraceae bacterium]